LRLILIGDRGVNLDLVSSVDLDYGDPCCKGNRGVRLYFAVATGNWSGEAGLLEGNMSQEDETFWGDEAEVLRRHLRAVAEADLTEQVDAERARSSRRAKV
jgi:hypothetical protein